MLDALRTCGEHDETINTQRNTAGLRHQSKRIEEILINGEALAIETRVNPTANTKLMGLYRAGSTYTTVGFANDQLPYKWQLITIIMATSGLFSFGWSTSVMFLLAQTLYPSQR